MSDHDQGADRSREQFVRLAGSLEEAIRFQKRCLALPDALLPPPARAVRDGAAPTVEYWQWLIVKWRAG
jgi:hypothetical protein